MTSIDLIVDYQSTDTLSWDIQVPYKKNCAGHVFPITPWGATLGQIFRLRRYEYVRLKKVFITVMPQPELNLERPWVEMSLWGNLPVLLADRVSFSPSFGRENWVKSRWPCELRRQAEGIVLEVCDEWGWIRNTFVTPRNVSDVNSFADIGYHVAMNTEFMIAAQVLARLCITLTCEYSGYKLTVPPTLFDEQIDTPTDLDDYLGSIRNQLAVTGNEELGGLNSKRAFQVVREEVQALDDIPFSTHLEIGMFCTEDMFTCMRAGETFDCSLATQRVVGSRIFNPCTVHYDNSHTTPVFYGDSAHNLSWEFAFEVAADVRIRAIHSRNVLEIERSRYPRDYPSILPYGPLVQRTIWRIDDRTGARSLIHQGMVDDQITEVDWSFRRNEIIVIQMSYVQSDPEEDLWSDLINNRLRLTERDRIVPPPIYLQGKIAN